SIWNLGLKTHKKNVLDFILGIFVGVFMISTVFVTEINLGLIRIEINSKINIGYLVYGLLASLSVAFMEELVFRGYLFQNALLSLSENQAILISSIVFGLMHVFNPNVNFLAMIVISIIGALLAICYLKTQGLHFPIGLHFTWNFFEGYIYGFPISGNKVEGILVTIVKGPAWLTGGNFGPEGGLIGLIVSLIVTLIAFFLYNSNKRKMM
ncbi:MAG: CPBP family intramembrane metalloprotease, partial [Candidatus Odinarchaeota archaeon]|nr:CPBP family intramembrane metalloprotease [Candidatus Odinarchaeota archaeon]